MLGFYLKSFLMLAAFCIGAFYADRHRKVSQMEADFCEAFHHVDQLIQTVSADPSKEHIAEMNRAEKRVTQMVIHSNGRLPVLCP